MDKMWGLLRTVHKTNQIPFSKTVIHTFPDRYKSCKQSPTICHYRSGVPGTTVSIWIEHKLVEQSVQIYIKPVQY